jgi:hypothetical protein
MSWKVAHACVRGSAHLRSGLPNQDAAQCITIPGEETIPPIAIAAVSDGHGGGRHFRSQIGSSLAVSTAIDVLQGFFAQHAGAAGADAIGADVVQQLQRELVDRWLVAVSADLENHPLTAEELGQLEVGDGAESRTAVETLPTLAYGATLLVAAATDDLILYLQLGDGEILCVDALGNTTRPLPADARLLGNQTTSLCQPEAWQEFRAAWSAAPDLPALVLLSTDGYANSFRSDEDFLKIGADYLEILREQGMAVLADELPEILNEATQQGSGDDITLAILQGDLKKTAAEGNGSPVKPKLSKESRSLLIEQLKARHSSQHRRLDELSTRLEQTRKDNRRLQLLVVFLVLVALAAGIYVFRGYLRPSVKPSDMPATPAPKTKPAPPPVASSRGGKEGNGARQWQLTISGSRKSMTIFQGKRIDCDWIAPCEEQAPPPPDGVYAVVARTRDGLGLVNNWGGKWHVKSTGGSKTITRGGSIPLDSEVKEVTFSNGKKGTISPLAASPASDASANPDQPPADDQPSSPAPEAHPEQQ